MKDAKLWIIGILLTVIFSLIAFSVHREMDRLDTQIEVLHRRINGNEKDIDGVQNDLSFLRGNIQSE